MAWKIVLEDENKKNLSSVNNEFEVNFETLRNNFRLLCYLDPYGDAFFNSLQMDDLIKDLQLLKIDGQELVIKEILALAECCKKDNHTYIAFYGD